MKKIMIFNVPAEKLGALNVLNEIYEEATLDESNNQYFFVLSKPNYPNKKNITVLNFPWIKKSWFHRLYFDYFIAYKIAKQHNVDEIISYQNVMIPRIENIKQTVFFHNAIPFSDQKFNILSDFKLWIYKNVLSKLIFRSLKKSDEIIVQTNWMKNKIIDSFKDIDPLKIVVKQHKLCSQIESKSFAKKIDSNNFNRKFIYPAAPFLYKNHEEIINACMLMNSKEKEEIEILFTFNTDQNKLSKIMFEKVTRNKLPIKFIGNLSPKEVNDFYKTHNLIFSSQIETLGIPLLEAQMNNTKIIYKKCDLFLEVVNGYNKSIAYSDHVELYKLIKSL